MNAAKDLRDTQTFGTQDPYAKVYIAGREREKIKTRVHDNGGRIAREFPFAAVAAQVLRADLFCYC